MAWGILMSCFTLFGMLVLAVATARMDETPAGVGLNEGTGPGSPPTGSESQRPAGSIAEPEIRKIAA